MKKYKHLFFDLDRTLWDFNQNSSDAISELFQEYQLAEKLGTDFQQFFAVYEIKNHRLWDLYREGKVTKDELRRQRYLQTFQEFGVDDSEMALAFNDAYVKNCSSRSALVPYTMEILDYLAPNYILHIITNGFKEAQEVKLRNSGLIQYFDQVIISDGIGFRKPDKRIFNYAMQKAGAVSKESLMIGDDYGPDVLGAKSVGMDQVFFAQQHDKGGPATYTITSLIELKEIL